jgi:hypothetical protein
MPDIIFTDGRNLYIHGDNFQTNVMKIIDVNNISHIIRNTFTSGFSAPTCYTYNRETNDLLFGLRDSYILTGISVSADANFTVTNYYAKMPSPCTTVSINSQNSRYVYYFVGSSIVRVERWDSFGKSLSSSYIVKEYLVEMSNTYISFVDEYHNLLFLISRIGTAKVIDISEYLDQKYIWFLIFVALTLLAVFAAIITVCCVYMLRKLRKQRKVEEELRELLGESIQTYGATSSSHMCAWIIPAEDLSIKKVIGTGAYGQVFEGLYQNTKVAIKKLKVTDSKLFEKEVGVLSSLRHPNVVLFLGVCKSGPYELIVTEFLELGSLDTFLREKRHNNERHVAFTFNKKIDILLDVARGMQYIHSQGLIHRDIKTSNILLDKHYTAKICDLGHSRMVSTNSLMTGTIGTLQYMSPEIILNQQYDNRTDVYSFGIVMYEVFFEKIPFHMIDEQNGFGNMWCLGIDVAKNEKRPAIPDDISDYSVQELDYLRCMKQCWKANPEDRPSFDEITSSLNNIKW